MPLLKEHSPNEFEYPLGLFGANGSSSIHFKIATF